MLASKSASRRAVLESAGIPVDIEPADVDERGIEMRAGLEGPDRIAALRGNIHTLHSAVCVMRGDAVLFENVDAAHLTMRPFSDGFLDSYLDAVGDKALASVGSYQLEGTGIQLFERVDGDHFTVLGLPLLPLLDWLRQAGLLAK